MIFRVRSATPADANGIARVQVDTWRTTYGGIVPDAHLDALSYRHRDSVWRQIISRKRSDESQFVAETDAGEVVAFASGGRGGREPAGDPEYDGELYAIYVLEPHQRQGIGRRLARAVVERLIDARFDAMLIWVLQDNPACRFYAALGGTPVRNRTISIGGADLPEVAYGWNDLALLGRSLRRQVGE